MKTLNDFRNENKDLKKNEMGKEIGGKTANPTRELTGDPDCMDVTTCYDIGNGARICTTADSSW